MAGGRSDSPRYGNRAGCRQRIRPLLAWRVERRLLLLVQPVNRVRTTGGEMSNDSIRVGDRFQGGRNGVTWVVTRTRPGGIVEMVTEDRTRLCEYYTRDVRTMTRLEGRDQLAIQNAAVRP